MFEQLHIRNFRGFRDLQVGPLHRVNLIAGRNDTGKSTLLEAIFLLSSTADPRLAVNEYVMRSGGVQVAGPATVAETIWKPLFFALDTGSPIEIAGHHASLGDMQLKLALERPVTTELPRDREKGTLPAALADGRLLAFTYADPQAGELSGRARETAEKVTFDMSDAKDGYPPFSAAILKPGTGDVTRDAVLLGQLRKQKRGGLLLDALRAIEPRLKDVVDNSSSGAPMLWADIGFARAGAAAGHGQRHDARRPHRADGDGREERLAAGGRD